MKRTRFAQRRRTVGLTQEMLAEQFGVDRTTIIRWENGQAVPLPWHRPNTAAALKISVEELAALLGDVDQTPLESWNVPVPIEIMWPELRHGGLADPAHLQVCTADRTLKELSIFVRTDMLTRRETLTQAVKAFSGPTLLTPIAGWLSTTPGPLEAREDGTQRIGASDVEALEYSTRFFATTEANLGSGLSREAAVGQLKYAVDLARHGNYSESTGHRLLAVIAELSGLVGYMCHDSGMPGPAQRYFLLGLQAARESADPRAPFLMASILTDLAEHVRYLDRPDTALRLNNLALDRLPADRGPRHKLRALLVARRAGNGLAYQGSSSVTETRSELTRSFDLYGQADDDDRGVVGVWHRAIDMSEAELAVPAAVSFTTLARTDRRLLGDAEKYTLHQLAKVPEDQGRSRLFAQIRLATVRFLAGDVEQACDDGDQALHLAGRVSSARVIARLRELLTDSEPYAKVTRVVQFRERMRTAIAGLN